MGDIIENSHPSQKVIFDESLRGLAQQERTLDGIRGRAGTLLTASSIITAFLGAQALEANQTVERVGGEAVARSEVTTLGWIAVACFIGVLAITIVLLLPRKWIFSHDIHRLMDLFLERQLRPPVDDLYYHLAYWNHVNAGANWSQLQRMLALFSVGCALLAAEAVLWLLVVVQE